MGLLPDPIQDSHGLILSLLELQSGRKTGVLDVKGEDVRTRIYIEEGKPVFADEGTLGETLGRILVKQRVLTEEQYTVAIERMTEARTEGKRLRFGEIVVELGYLTTAQVTSALTAQVKQKVVRCLQWEHPTWSFDASPARLEGIARFPTTVEPLVLAALRMLERARLDTVLQPHAKHFPKLKLGAATTAEVFRLEGPEARFLGLIDGSRSMAALLTLRQPDSVDPPAILAVLVLTEAAELLLEARGATAPARPVSEPPPEAPPATSKRSPSLAPTRHSVPPNSIRPPSQDQKERAVKTVGRLRLKRLSDPPAVSTPPPVPRTPVDDQEARLLAEHAFQAGKAHLRGNRVIAALPHFKGATVLYPGAIEYRLYAAWAEFRLEPEKEAERTPELRDLAKRALKQDPQMGFGYYVLGHLALRDGEFTEANDLLERAMKLDDSLEQERHIRITKRTSKGTSGAPPTTPSGGPRAADVVAAAQRKKLAAADAKPPPLAPRALALAPPLPNPSAGKVAAAAPNTVPREEPTSTSTLEHDSDPSPPRAPSPVPPAPVTSLPAPGKDIGSLLQATLDGPSEPEADEEAGADKEEDAEVAEAKPVAAAAKKKPNLLMFGLLGVLVLAGGAGAFMWLQGATPPVPGPAPLPPATTAAATVTARPSANLPQSAVEAGAAAPGDGGSDAGDAGKDSGLAGDAGATSSLDDASAAAIARDAAAAIVNATPEAGASEPGMGDVNLPDAAKGHRVFVDGRTIGEAPGRLRLPCGAHAIKVGSSGKERKVDVPCGGVVTIDSL